MEIKKEFTGVDVSIKLTREESEALALAEKVINKVTVELEDMLKEDKYSQISVFEEKYFSENYKSYQSLIENIYERSRTLFEVMEDNCDVFEDGFEIYTHNINN